jgi:NCS1 family nucleobase:cation symporter-1
VAAVDTSVVISDGATKLYYLNYLYGFVASAVAYSLLHCVLPDRKFHAFIQDGTSARETQGFYNGRWRVVEAQTPEIEDDCEEQTAKGEFVTSH